MALFEGRVFAEKIKDLKRRLCWIGIALNTLSIYIYTYIQINIDHIKRSCRVLNKLYRYAPDNTDSKYRMALFLLPMQLSFQISHTQTSLLETLSKIVSPLALLSFSAPAEGSGVRSTPGTLTVLQLLLLSSHGTTSSLLAWGALLGMGQGTKCKRKP